LALWTQLTIMIYEGTIEYFQDGNLMSLHFDLEMDEMLEEVKRLSDKHILHAVNIWQRRNYGT